MSVLILKFRMMEIKIDMFLQIAGYFTYLHP